MNSRTKQIAYQLLAALAVDPDAQADLALYGDWSEHLTDQLNDDSEEA